MMRFLAVDDEPRALRDICETLGEAVANCELASFTSPAKALEYGESNPIDVAFLDIEMGRISGLALAKKLKDLNPDIHIIFVTSYEKYAVDAFRIHATGYLMKPVRAEDIQRELTFIYGSNPTETCSKIRVQTFGGFDVFVDGKPLIFKRAKAKELLAYLIDRRGNSVTTGEACAILWEDAVDDKGQKSYFRTVVTDLRATLRSVEIEDILIKGFNHIAVDANRLDCDYYRFLEGDPQAVNSYRRDYLPSYSWAEFSLGVLESCLH